MSSLKSRLPTRRTYLKVLHWSVVPLFIWFIFITPSDVMAIGRGAIRFHSVLGLLFVTLSLIWFADYMRRGLASRPGPKLPSPARRIHSIMHRSLVWGLFIVAFGGFGLGVSSHVMLWAGGIVPVGYPMNWPLLNEIIGKVHIYEFYLLAILVGFHIAFHIWRHVRLRDNALRIMAPKILHRFL